MNESETFYMKNMYSLTGTKRPKLFYILKQRVSVTYILCSVHSRLHRSRANY